MNQVPQKVAETLVELRATFATLAVLVSTDPRDEVRHAVRRFGRCMAEFEEAVGLTGGDDAEERGTSVIERMVINPAEPPPLETEDGKREDVGEEKIARVIWDFKTVVTQAIKDIASEMRQLRLLQEKRFEDSVRTTGSRR